MKYINLLLIFGISLLTISQLAAQQDRDKREQLEQMKIAFITKKMNLSTEDAQKFWPIYNKYQTEIAKLRQEKQKEKGLLDIDSMSEAEAKALYTQHIEKEEQKIVITQSMVRELEQLFSAKQILSYLAAEERFKRQVLDNIKEKMKEKEKMKKGKNH